MKFSVKFIESWVMGANSLILINVEEPDVMEAGKLRQRDQDKWQEVGEEVSFGVLSVEASQQEENNRQDGQEFFLVRPILSEVQLLEVRLAFCVAHGGDPRLTFY